MNKEVESREPKAKGNVRLELTSADWQLLLLAIGIASGAAMNRNEGALAAKIWYLGAMLMKQHEPNS